MYYNIKEQLKPEEILMYLRKSRADDPQLSVSEVLSNHEKEIDEWSENNLSALIPECNRYREVVSGESLSERVEFQKILKLAESPSIKAIIVKEIARLGRPDTMEIGLISKTLRYTNTMVISAKPFMTFNLSVQYERDMFENELKYSNHYLEYVKTILADGRDRSVKSGNYLCVAPYGYDKTQIVENKKKCSTLAVNEEQANIVRMIFDWYVNENIGTQTISHRLNELNIKSPRGKAWTPDSIRTVLENIHYIGMIRWNTRKGILVVDNGEFRKTRPKTPEEAIIVKGKHEAIISEEIFQAAQEKRGRSHKMTNQGGRKLKNPLASLMYCECGRAMSYRASTHGECKHRPAVLVCNRQTECGNGSIRVTEMMEFMVDALREKIAEFEIEVKNVDNESSNLHEKMIKSLEKKLADLNAKEISLWEAQVDTDATKRMPPHVFEALTDKLTKEREETESALAKARETVVKPIDYEKKIVTFRKALDALLDDEVSVDEKNHLLKQCIQRIDYRREAPTKMLGKGAGRQWIMKPVEIDIKWML